MIADNPQQKAIQLLMQEESPIERGSLYWVDERVWHHCSIDQKYPMTSRKRHPGLVQCLFRHYIILIHGHSRPKRLKRCELAIQGIDDPKRTSYFSVGIRFPVPPHMAWGKSALMQNRHMKKTRLTDSEMKQLVLLERNCKPESVQTDLADSKKVFHNQRMRMALFDLGSENKTGRDTVS